MSQEQGNDNWPTNYPAKTLKHVLPTKVPTAFEHEANLPKTEARNYSSAMPVDSAPQTVQKPATGNDLQDKIYMFPESYNALRKELVENWPNLWNTVGYWMAFDAIRFIELMDYALDVKTTWDSAKVGAICHRYWNELRAKRGLSKIPYGDGSGTLVIRGDR